MNRSLRKTKIMLDSFEKARKPVSYYALDLSEAELRNSLEKLGEYTVVETTGLWGEYGDGMKYLRHLQSLGRPLLVMWLGSSIGNQHRGESDKFVRKLSQFLNAGDQLLIGKLPSRGTYYCRSHVHLSTNELDRYG